MILPTEFFGLLDEAVVLASEYSGGYSNQFIGAEAFYAALATAVWELKEGDYTKLDDLWLWFAPTCSWDDFIGLDGMDLGNRIFEHLDVLRRRR